MASSTKPKKFALLVGVDLYMNDKSRQLENGDIVSLSSLRGAVNDVKYIQSLLQDKFQFDQFSVLTSSVSSEPNIPGKVDDTWPTHVNIKREFDNIRNEAGPGDVFFFHFSGHGAGLRTTPSSPKDGRSKDPSLMTVDYCCGKPAIRGWELNEWLLQFNQKNVRVIVLLDSCHSAASWRVGNRIRCPENWKSPPNLPSDEAAAQATQSKPGHRDGDLDVSWDLNPKDFTLMAACRHDQTAAENTENDKTGADYGAFTLALKKYFEDLSNPLHPTYSFICDHTTARIVSWDLPQKPQVFGRDRLAFLEDYEPSWATPIVGTLQKGIVTLPVGKVHGISKGAEFIMTTLTTSVIVSMYHIDNHKSKGNIVSGFIQDQSQAIQVVPFRWSSEETLNIVVAPNLGATYRKKLISDLENRIVGEIQCAEGFQSIKDDDSRAIWFRLGVNEDGGIDIFGPDQLVGGQGPVRGWKTKGKSDEEKARESAIALAHLFRFGQILNLRNESQGTPPFQVTVQQVGDKNDSKFEFKFQNHENKELYFAVLILSSGFHVKQLFPAEDTLRAVSPGGMYSFTFRLAVPDKLRRIGANHHQPKYRDIIRTVVTRGNRTSLKSMELPDIWDADQWEAKRPSGSGRDGTIEEEFNWWIQDDEKFVE